MSETAQCSFCGRTRFVGAVCHNTRDMTDFAIEGDEDCLKQIALCDGGEAGLRYIILNRYLKLNPQTTERTYGTVEAGWNTNI